jgi:hypothetical protein
MATIVTSELVLEDHDSGYDEVKRQLASLAGVRIETGLFDEEQAQKGAWAEFGTDTTEPRPWLSVAADQGANVIANKLREGVENVVDGAPAKAEMEKVGEVAAKLARDVLGSPNVQGPALAESTVERKGSSAKLVDEGDMKRAIKSKVRVRGRK